MRTIASVLTALMLALLVAAPVSAGGDTEITAGAQLHNADGEVVGEATFTQVEGGVLIEAEVSHLEPGMHGIHIHETAQCDPPDFKSAGGHFNPEDRQHGLDSAEGPHAGDLPNLEVGEDGSGTYETTTDRVTLTEGEASLYDDDGSALVIHAGEDDQVTDPTGDSGDRVACGVIEQSELPEEMPETGAGGLATGASVPWGSLGLAASGLLAAGYAALRRRYRPGQPTIEVIATALRGGLSVPSAIMRTTAPVIGVAYLPGGDRMAPVAARWDNDERGHGIADGSAHAPHLHRLLDAMASPGWVAEDPDAHLLPKLSAACREVGSPWTLLSARHEGAVYEVALAWDRADAGIGRLRADAYALIGAVAEGSTYVRQRVTDGEILIEVTTGMLDGDSEFSGHGHLVRLIVRGEAANTIARSK